MNKSAIEPDRVPWRLQIAVYGIGLFSTTMFYMAAVVVPLWVARLESSPLLVGMVLGSRHFLPLFLSIHGGALMDRLGGRRVMIFFGAVSVVTPLLFPALPWIGAVLALQMIAGLCDSMGWLGAQTLTGQHMRGSTVYTGRLSFVQRFGHLAAPPAIGWVWDSLGPTAAFVGLSIWGCGTLVCALMLPPAGTERLGGESGPQVARPSKVRMVDLLPRLSDYINAFRLLSVPAIALMVMISMMSHMGSSMQSTFYVVYLGGQGFSGTQIGSLLSAASIAAIAGALISNQVSRRIKPYWMMMGFVLAGVLAIALTPLLGTLLLLTAAAAVRGGANGVNQPMVISTVLRAVGPAIRGSAAGVRGTMNRVASIGAPVLMGAVAEFAGIEASFYIVGMFATLVMAGLVVHVLQSEVLSASNRIAGH